MNSSGSSTQELNSKVQGNNNLAYNDSTLESDLPSLNYEEVPIINNDDDDLDDFTKIFNVLSSPSQTTATESTTNIDTAAQESTNTEDITYNSTYNHKPTSDSDIPSPDTMSADDFVRNYLVIRGMKNTLDTFQCEWYEQQLSSETSNSKLNQIAQLPNIYQQNLVLQQQLLLLNDQVTQSLKIADSARDTWSRFKRERDVHRLHHRRLAQEKNALIAALTRLRKHVQEQEPIFAQMQHRYEVACKEKIVLRSDKKKLTNQVLQLQQEISELKGEISTPNVCTLRTQEQTFSSTVSAANKQNTKNSTNASKDGIVLPSINNKNTTSTNLNSSALSNHYFATPADQSLDTELPQRASFQGAILANAFKAHKLGVTSLSVSPVAPVLATSSDDHTWKLHAVPSGEVIMTGSGHTSWISSISFSQSGAHVATASADATVKLWSLASQKVVHKLQHSQIVWDAKYHNSGNALITGCNDNHARLWDVETGNLLRVYRGHVGSVNTVKWMSTNISHASLKQSNHSLPQLNQIFMTGSGDNTVSLWDARSGICVQTLTGHNSPITSIDSLGGAIITSDASGIVKVWDLISNTERVSLRIGKKASINCVTFDPSGTCFLAGMDDGRAEVYSLLPTDELMHSNTQPSLDNLGSDKAKSFFYGLSPEYGSNIEMITEFETQESQGINDLVIQNNTVYGATAEGQV